MSWSWSTLLSLLIILLLSERPKSYQSSSAIGRGPSISSLSRLICLLSPLKYLLVFLLSPDTVGAVSDTKPRDFVLEDALLTDIPIKSSLLRSAESWRGDPAWSAICLVGSLILSACSCIRLVVGRRKPAATSSPRLGDKPSGESGGTILPSWRAWLNWCLRLRRIMWCYRNFGSVLRIVQSATWAAAVRHRGRNR